MASNDAQLGSDTFVKLPQGPQSTSSIFSALKEDPAEENPAEKTVVEVNEATDENPVRKSTRSRTLTEKGKEWSKDMLSEHFRHAVSSWRRNASQLEQLSVDTKDVALIKQQAEKVSVSMNTLGKIYNDLHDSRMIDSDMVKRFEGIEEENYHLMKRNSQRIEALMEADELCSRRSTKSSATSSHHSSRSSRSQMSERAKLTIKAATLKPKLKFVDAENAKKSELARLRVEKELHVAEATLQAVDAIEREELSGEEEEEVETNQQVGSNTPPPIPHLVGPENLQNPHPLGLAPSTQSERDETPKHPMRPQTQVATGFDEAPMLTYQQVTPQMQYIQPNSIQHLLDQIEVGRLPPPDPGVFTGDPLQFPSWKAAFDTLIERKNIPNVEKIYYLKKYLGGQAKETVEGYFLMMTDDAYDRAKELLIRRYGEPFVIANAFRDKLDDWQKIPTKDGKGLRKFADFMLQCQAAMERSEHLQVFNDQRENKRILMKLPEWLVTRWSHKVMDYREIHGSFPPFKYFVKFIQREADIACDPVTSLQALKMSDKSSDKPSRTTRTLVTTNSDSAKTPKESPKKATKETKANDEQKKTTSKSAYKRVCPACGTEHKLVDCTATADWTFERKQKLVMDKALCFKCLTPGHRAVDCRRPHTCRECQLKHPTFLHDPTRVRGEPKPKNEPDSSSTTPAKVSSFTVGPDPALCAMTVPVWISNGEEPAKEELTFALLDTQSDTTFVSNDLYQKLGVGGTEVQLKLSTMTSENHILSSIKVRGLTVRAYDGEKKIMLPTAYTRPSMPVNRSHIPSPQTARKWPYLMGISDKLVSPNEIDVGLLIGYNCPKALMPTEVIPPEGEGPYALKTELGWGIVGIVDSDVQDDDFGTSHHIIKLPEQPTIETKAMLAVQHTTKEMLTCQDVTRLMNQDFNDHDCEAPSLSQEDKRFLQLMEVETHKRGNHYEMPLPFKSKPRLPNNLVLAEQRFSALQKKVRRDVKYKADYEAFMTKIITAQHAEKVPADELEGTAGRMWYIPHHGVYGANGTKIRVVFDASASFKGTSLNDLLLSGPDLTNSLIGVLMRFRQERIALACDVEQMFHQFLVNPEDRDFLRFIWEENGNPAVYRMKVHLFGAKSSPSCANFGLKRIAADGRNEYGDQAASFIETNFYVDDGLISVKSEAEAKTLIQTTIEMCRSGGLRLHKFVSNSKEVIQTVNIEDRAQGLRDLNLSVEDLPVEKTLGIQWCVESDAFQFRVLLKDSPLTRRGVLSMVSSIYDPLGFIAPMVLVGKQILQEMCRSGADWDTPLPTHLRSRWDRWRQDLIILADLKISRCFKPEGFGTIKHAALHHFSDASLTGYSQCSYVRLENELGEIHCSFVMGKCKVTPLKSITVPRLELAAAVLSIRASQMIRRELEYKIDSEMFWTDSKVVLGYIANDSSRFKIFVANRVQAIRDHSTPEQWQHVPSKENSADQGSRGLTAKELEDSPWLKGPAFLWRPLYIEKPDIDISEEDPELKKTRCLATQTEETDDMLSRFHRFSSWTLLLRAVAVILRFKQQFLKKKRERSPSQVEDSTGPYEPVSVPDIHAAEIEVVRLLQASAFPEEQKLLKSLTTENIRDRKRQLKKGSALHRLDPFLDPKGIIRIGGRLNLSTMDDAIKHPMILPQKGHVVEMLVRHTHERTAHQGRGMTINEIRSRGFWITGCTSVVAKIIRKCVTCRRLRSAVEEQKMADFPADRLEEAPPFTYCAVDIFGPWSIQEGRRTLKRYGVLYTCLGSRAVHVEVANSLSTDSFINSLRRLIAIRGPIRQLRSDCGTNFVGAQRELKEAAGEMDVDGIRQFLLSESCDLIDFKMNPPSASHRGGVWERQIRSIRSVLNGLMSKHGHQLDDESLRTLMTEAAAIVNGRPLSAASLNDPTCSPLVPNNILTMKSSIILPPPGKFMKEDLYCRRRWRRVQHVLNEFWNKWRHEFIQERQKRVKWTQPRRSLAVGDVVIVKDEQLPRNSWPLGRVVETTKGTDGLVRHVKLKMASSGNKESHLVRPIQKLVLLLENDDDA